MEIFHLVAIGLVLTLIPGNYALVGNDKQEPSITAPWNATSTDLLKRSLLAGYDKFARPTDHGKSTNVSMGLSVYHLEVDDKTSIMTIHGWVRMSWWDNKLKWNESDYEGLTTLNVGDHEVWQPDIIQYNSATGNAVDQYGNTHCLIDHNGFVIWVPPAKMSAFCKMDLTKWPRDEHTCIFTFGSWTYDGYQINLNNYNESMGFETEDLIENGEWELVGMTEMRKEKVYPCCPNPYVSVDYEFHIRRRASGARAILTHSLVYVAIFLALLSHCLPLTSLYTPRMPLAVIPPTILALSLLYFCERIPATTSTPDIVMLYSISLYLVCISGIISVIVVNMITVKKMLPWAIRKMLGSGFAQCLRLPKLTNQTTAEELQGAVSGGNGAGNEEGAQMLSRSPPLSRDWLALATAVDRITFIIILIVFVITAIFYRF